MCVDMVGISVAISLNVVHRNLGAPKHPIWTTQTLAAPTALSRVPNERGEEIVKSYHAVFRQGPRSRRESLGATPAYEEGWAVSGPHRGLLSVRQLCGSHVSLLWVMFTCLTTAAICAESILHRQPPWLLFLRKAGLAGPGEDGEHPRCLSGIRVGVA